MIRAQIHTNLASQLSNFGRPIEAIRGFDKALLHIPNFAMALLNRGLARETLARLLYDRGHAALIAYFAHKDYASIVKGPVMWDGHYYGIYEDVKNRKMILERVFDIEKIKSMLETSSYSLGKTVQEKAYQTWALENGLYVNPLTSIGPFPIGATDILHMPPHKAKDISDPPHFISWFNQLKQEFIAARFFLFESQHAYKAHYADNETHLIDTLDASLHGIHIEKMRAAYRIAYGLLDKIAGFINAYFSLGEKPGSVNFKTIWLTKDRKDIRPEFKSRENLALRGLYWLAFDIVGDDPEDGDSIAPGAKTLYRIRNALEHRCLIIREFNFGKAPTIFEAIGFDEFESHCIDILHLAHAAIIYLSLAVWSEENDDDAGDDEIVVSMPLPPYKNPRHL